MGCSLGGKGSRRVRDSSRSIGVEWQERGEWKEREKWEMVVSLSFDISAGT